jgi:hypothetical protein
MDSIASLTILNFLFILIFLVLRRSTKMTYTEMIVTRRLFTYFLSLLLIIVIALLFMHKLATVKIIILTLHLILAFTLLAYFIIKFIKYLTFRR